MIYYKILILKLIFFDYYKFVCYFNIAFELFFVEILLYKSTFTT